MPPKAPPGVRLVYTYPNFTSCSELDYSASVERWDNPILWPLDPHVSPMQGWLDVAKTVTTPYTYLVHNDGYGPGRQVSVGSSLFLHLRTPPLSAPQ